MLSVVAVMVATAQAAEPSPAVTGLKTGAVTVGGSALGTLAGGAAGVGLGALSCQALSGPECWAPVLGGIFGSVSGYVGGGVLAAGWSASRQDLDARRVRRWGLITVGSGLAITGIGLATSAEPLLYAGFFGSAAGLPIATGIAAGTDSRAQLSLQYDRERGTRGVALNVAF